MLKAILALKSMLAEVMAAHERNLKNYRTAPARESCLPTQKERFCRTTHRQRPEGDVWQMPLLALMTGRAEQAALRELVEETGISPGLVEDRAQPNEHFYDLPEELR
jgi:8-oxo-dGTP pyrophosphatase MutT (NUDIX family)